MKDLSSTNHEAFRVRPMESRDLVAGLERFPDVLAHLDPQPSFFHEAFSGGQSAWVAESQEQLVGMALLSIDSPTLARLTYLHVAGNGPYDAPAARALAEIAIRKAWDAGCLKLAIHTPIPSNHLAQYMHELGFEFARVHSSDSQRVHEFYRNLYQLPRDPSSGVAGIQ